MKQIVLLDSDQLNIDIFSDAFKRYINIPYNLVQMTDGDEAFKFISELKVQIDLLITDIMHPGRTCFDIIGLIRKRFPEAKVIIISAAGGYFTEEQLSLADVYLPKPFNLNTTFIKIIKCLLNINTH